MARALRVPVSSLESGELWLDEAASHYAVRVHRLKPGDQFVIFDPKQRLEADATLLEHDKQRARCAVEAARPARTVAPRPLVLLQAMGKGDKPERVVRDAVALGATGIVFLLSERSAIKPGSNVKARWARLLAIATEAARQSERGDLPELIGPLSLDEAVQLHTLPPARVCLEPTAEKPFLHVLETLPEAGRGVALLVGPEGGLAQAELSRIRAHEFVPASLGRFVLRTELAAGAALACYANWALLRDSS